MFLYFFNKENNLARWFNVYNCILLLSDIDFWPDLAVSWVLRGGGDQDGFRGFPEMYLHLYPILDTGFTEMPHWGFILIPRPTLRSRELLSVNCGENISIKGIRKETD